MSSRDATSKKTARLPAGRRWSQHVTETSHALELKHGVFALKSAKAIAESLYRSAVASTRRKSDPYRSAMSMLTFYINRAGKNLPQERLDMLESAKSQLRAMADATAETKPRATKKSTQRNQRAASKR